MDQYPWRSSQWARMGIRKSSEGKIVNGIKFPPTQKEKIQSLKISIGQGKLNTNSNSNLMVFFLLLKKKEKRKCKFVCGAEENNKAKAALHLYTLWIFFSIFSVQLSRNPNNLLSQPQRLDFSPPLTLHLCGYGF